MKCSDQYLFSVWMALMRTLRIDEDKARDEFLFLYTTYTNNDLDYHNLDHISHVIQISSAIMLSNKIIEHPHRVLIAGFYHDLIYSPLSHTNEDDTIAVTRERLRSLGYPEQHIESVCNSIDSTKHKYVVSCIDPESMAVCDADLAILGASKKDYDVYAASIRSEYDWYTYEEYATGRIKLFIDKMLDRGTVYSTEFMKSLYNKAAFENLNREKRKLLG